ncbi:MAG TPA: metallophosphoesterase [Blastocatellia bacterium]|nr:metallophosphoesterase [Blastocatellia bacterium]
MRVFAIGDPHLSHFKPKPMDIFGENWRDHDKQIMNNWNAIGTDDDILILAGDLSWAMKLEEFLPDLEYISALKGRKILIKGNHDLWWSSASKVRRVLPPGVDILDHDSIVINGIAFVGTRGWTIPERESFNEEEDRKIYEREVGRLGLAFDSLKGKSYDHLTAIIHYPPTNQNGDETAFTKIIEEHGTEICVYGHLHSNHIPTGFNGQRGSTRYKLVSADSVNFTPYQIL